MKIKVKAPRKRMAEYLDEVKRDLENGNRAGYVDARSWWQTTSDLRHSRQRTPEQIAEGAMTSFNIVDGDVQECSADYIQTIIEEAVKEARA